MPPPRSPLVSYLDRHDGSSDLLSPMRAKPSRRRKGHPNGNSSDLLSLNQKKSHLRKSPHRNCTVTNTAGNGIASRSSLMSPIGERGSMLQSSCVWPAKSPESKSDSEDENNVNESNSLIENDSSKHKKVKHVNAVYNHTKRSSSTSSSSENKSETDGSDDS